MRTRSLDLRQSNVFAFALALLLAASGVARADEPATVPIAWPWPSTQLWPLRPPAPPMGNPFGGYYPDTGYPPPAPGNPFGDNPYGSVYGYPGDLPNGPPIEWPSTPMGPPAFSATAQQVRVRGRGKQRVLEYLNPHAAGEWLPFGRLSWHRKGTRYHHWGPTSDVQRWAAQGISPADIEHAITTYDPTDAAGGGFYVSLDPVDSANYGPNQLVAEPEHGTLVLDVGGGAPPAPPNSRDPHSPPAPSSPTNPFGGYGDNGGYGSPYGFGYEFDRDHMGFVDAAHRVLIPVAAMAHAGVEGLQYSGNWLVTVRGSLLERVFEFSWQEYARHPMSKRAGFNTLSVLADKYPPTAAALADAAFRRCFPWLARLLLDKPLTASEGKQLSELVFQQLFGSAENPYGGWSMGGGGGPNGFDAKSKLGQLLPRAVRPLIRARLPEALQAALARDSGQNGYYSGGLTAFLNALHTLGWGLHDIDPGSREFWDPAFATQPVFPASSPFGPYGPVSPFGPVPGLPPVGGIQSVRGDDGVWYAYGGTLENLKASLAWTDVYTLIDQIGRGNPTPWYIEGQTPPALRDPQAWFTLAMQATGDLRQFAANWSPGVDYRDLPAVTSGPFHLDGADRPGYFLVSAAQKAELEAHPFLVSRFVPKSDGPPAAFYAQYEYPSARTYTRFAALLAGTPLLTELRAADAAGQLADPSSEASRRLTREIVRTFVEGMPIYGMPRVHTLARLHPFGADDLNRNVLRATAAALSLQLPSWDLAQGATYVELTEAASLGMAALQHLNRYLSPDTAGVVDLKLAVGLWEYAANDPRPHADPASFAETIRTAFFAPETAARLRAGDAEGVRQALEQAAQAVRTASTPAAGAVRPQEQLARDCLRAALGAM